ncbi:MAG: hypothetical protein MUC88_29240 [Planctomycetes bacterium]|jgi:hypothetical protein|nr:hypothetical protein [Planctomycetota bacterium]
MKRLIIIGVVTLAILTQPMPADEVEVGWVSVDRASNHYEGRGGEFTVFNIADLGDNLSPAGYVAGKSSDIAHAPSFQTFCVETDEYINIPSHNLKAYVSEYAVKGGGGGELDDMDYLEAPTAWLYTQFATGQLTGYNYGTADSAGTLQRLIWGLESEGGIEAGFATDWKKLSNTYCEVTLSAADKTLIGTWQSQYAASGWSGIGNVRVLNLYTVNSPETPVQSQLYLVPLPGTVLLGLLGLGAAGRKLHRFV